MYVLIVWWAREEHVDMRTVVIGNVVISMAAAIPMNLLIVTLSSVLVPMILALAIYYALQYYFMNWILAIENPRTIASILLIHSLSMVVIGGGMAMAGRFLVDWLVHW